MDIITQLENLGYSFALEGDKIRAVFTGDSPDPVLVRPLLAELSRCKNEAIQFLQQRAAPESFPILPADDYFNWLKSNNLEVDHDAPLKWLPHPTIADKEIVALPVRPKSARMLSTRV